MGHGRNTSHRPTIIGGLRIRGILVLLLVTETLVGITLIAHEWVGSRERKLIRDLIRNDSTQVARHAQKHIDEHLRHLYRLRWAWSDANHGPDRCTQIAVDSMQEYPAYAWIAGVDPAGICRWEAADAAQEPSIDVNLSRDPVWGPSILRSAAAATETVLDSQAGPPSNLGIVFPPLPAKANQVLVRLDLEHLLVDSIDENNRRDLNIELHDGPILRTRVGQRSPQPPGLLELRPLRLGNREMQLSFWPTEAALRLRTTGLARWILWAGLAFSLAACIILSQFLVYRRRELTHTRSYLSALESLNEISTAISGRLGSGREVLDQLAQFALQLLGVARSGVGLIDDQTGKLHIYAFAGDIPLHPPDSFELNTSLPAITHCLESGQILFEEDVARAKVPINQAVAATFYAGSIILIPLRVEGRSIGLLALSDSRPRRFTPAERRLARLLGSQAAVILANNRLYDQILRNAETRAVLLRELHHRVKNNLAGIVGLLSIRQPQLTPEAQAWLDRIVQRIQTMARAHDLFGGGIDRVPLDRLVRQVISSLSVITPSAVNVETDLYDGHVELGSAQAIGLAMSLHELCSNALVHGIPESGTLLIRSRRLETGIAIDVCDDGSDAGALDSHLRRQSDGRWIGDGDRAVDAIRIGGIGLTLVRELVARELHGVFRIGKMPDGGTTATIEFPVSSAQPQGAAS